MNIIINTFVEKMGNFGVESKICMCLKTLSCSVNVYDLSTPNKFHICVVNLGTTRESIYIYSETSDHQ